MSAVCKTFAHGGLREDDSSSSALRGGNSKVAGTGETFRDHGNKPQVENIAHLGNVVLAVKPRPLGNRARGQDGPPPQLHLTQGTCRYQPIRTRPF